MFNTLTDSRVAELEAIAARIRGHVVRAVHRAQGGHIGGPLSCADIVTALYFQVLQIDPAHPDWPERDRFVLSKGHSCLAQYAAMAERGYFPVAELATFDQLDSRLQGHPDMTRLPGLDMSTGSLGQGISAAVGMALGARLRGQSFHSYVLLGDGESQEGQVWEAAFVAARYGLDHLTAILDWNGLQQYGWTDPAGRQVSGLHQQLPPQPDPCAAWRAFGWHVEETDGHDIRAFLSALARAQAVPGVPSIVVAHTVKGKGVSFMEHDPSWHARVPTDAELVQALEELGQEVAPW